MKKLKNNLDEMQELLMLRTEKRGFWLMFWGLLAVIAVQILIYHENGGRQIIGEVAVLFAGSVYTVASSVRNGIWDRRIPATPAANAAVSAISSGVFAVVLTVEKYIRYGSLPGALAAGAVFFVFIFLICFAFLSVMLSLYKRRKKRLDEEE